MNAMSNSLLHSAFMLDKSLLHCSTESSRYVRRITHISGGYSGLPSDVQETEHHVRVQCHNRLPLSTAQGGLSSRSRLSMFHLNVSCFVLPFTELAWPVYEKPGNIPST